VRAPGIDLLELAGSLSASLGIDVDVVPLDGCDVPLLEEIVEHGVRVYEAMPGAYAAWRSVALAMLEIDGPWYARMRDGWLRAVAQRGLRTW
jgi:hypothetical protein